MTHAEHSHPEREEREAIEQEEPLAPVVPIRPQKAKVTELYRGPTAADIEAFCADYARKFKVMVPTVSQPVARTKSAPDAQSERTREHQPADEATTGPDTAQPAHGRPV